MLEEAKSDASSRSSISREEHGRVVAENRQLAAQVARGWWEWAWTEVGWTAVGAAD